MSYPKDLDEYEETRLRAELRTRAEWRARGLCDYCSQPLGQPLKGPYSTAPTCRMPERHNADNLIYVASSWRNPVFEHVIDTLRASGLACYDFKRDEGAAFHWSEVGVDDENETAAGLLVGLAHPRSVVGHESDYRAMQRSHTCVLVLPCNRSAHLELGWFVGQGRRTAILLPSDGPIVPELTYRLVDYVAASLDELVAWLKHLPLPILDGAST